jgi:hypothetical protein
LLPACAQLYEQLQHDPESVYRFSDKIMLPELYRMAAILYQSGVQAATMRAKAGISVGTE